MRTTRTAIVLFAAAGIAVLAGCATTQPVDAPSSTSTQVSAASPSALPPVTVTAQPPVTVTAAPATPPPAPVTITQTAPPPVIIQQQPDTVYVRPPAPQYSSGIYGLPSGLLCRDLRDMGYSFSQAWEYWNYWGQPDTNDIDFNGIPCETVWAPNERYGQVAGD